MALYPYQEIVKTLILSGKSVILQAPTGSGKTRAALAPFIEGYFERRAEVFPHKCVYAVPMKILANQFVIDYQEHAKSYERRFNRKLNVQIQTGDQSGDPRFEGDLIFCTIDQFLSSYLTMPYSLPGRMANLNAGAMVGAYIILDEFHLLDPGSTLATTLYAIKQLRQLAPVLLMTATFSQSMLGSLARELDAEVVVVPQHEATAIETRQGLTAPRQRTWRMCEQTLTAQTVLDAHRSRSLALCNTVRRAQSLYRELRDLIQAQNMEVKLLLSHSRFLPDDRRATEDELRRLFGKDADKGGSVITVATQTIEVGVDITCETLHTELAPASSLIQRAGRCARFPGEQGQVCVYPVESYMPYGNAGIDPDKDDVWVKEMKATEVWLRDHNGMVFDFAKEQELVDAVATARDRAVLAGLSAGRKTHMETVYAVLNHSQNAGQAQRVLVRDADSRRVLVHSDPDRLLHNPYGATGFNLDVNTLRGMFNSWQKREADADWRVKYLVSDDADSEESNRTNYSWLPINDVQLLTGVQVIAVNPALAGYLSDEGFVADQGNTGFESALPPDAGKRTWDGLSYRLESYKDHIQRVLRAFDEIVIPEISYPAAALERAANWQAGSVTRAAWLVCLLHDVGKLSTGWQNWAHAYQKQIGTPITTDYAAAHTDYDVNNPVHKAAEKTVRPIHHKPHHAGEGAMAVSIVIAQALNRNEALTRAALSAIVRHHTPFATDCGIYKLVPKARLHIEATVASLPQEIKPNVDAGALKTEVTLPPNTFPSALARPEHDYEWLAYLLLARALRRADQDGTARGTKK